MKKIITLFLFFLGFNNFVFCQVKNEIHQLTSGKWQIESIEIEDEIMKVSEQDNWMVFYENGFYEIYLDNEEQIGTWKLDEQNNLKFDLEGFTGESGIRELTGNQLKFSVSGYTLALNKS